MDLIVSAVFGTLIQNLADFISEKTTAMLGLEGELERLHRRLTFVETLISHAEIRSFRDSSASNWLNLLRDFAYDAEDIIDSCRSWSQGEISLLEDREQSSSSSSDVLVSGKLSILSWFKNARFRSRINAQIEKLNDRLNDICDDKLVSTLELTKPNERVGVTAVNWKQTCPLVEPDIVGEEITIATKELVEVIVGFTEKMIRIVGIVGMGGIGKTTLAQKVYNDPKISGNFEHQMWVCVSQNYSEIDLLKQIIRAFRVDCRMGETTGELQCVLSSAIYGKSFFLVLDDVWQSDVWTSLLKTPLRNAINGIIVITTRDRNILVRLQAAYIHQVNKMPRNSGWELLCKSSYISSDEAKSLENIGMQIVNKCDFLPLAIKAIGGVLTTKNKTERDWGNLLSNDVWSIKDLPDVIGGALYLSYRDLPSNLKQCFLFICLYPEDAAMSRTDLIRFWVAAGFVKSQKDKLLEEIAEEYYYELINRSFLLLDSQYPNQFRCKIHDLFRSLGLHLSQRHSFYGDPRLTDSNTISKIRHLSINSNEETTIDVHNKINSELQLRTILLFGRRFSVENVLLNKLPYLRILHLNSREIKIVPDSVSSLVHLRMLDLDHTNISSLPESIGSLKNLFFLSLVDCQFLHILPKGLTRLCNLRRIGLRYTPINQVPQGIGKLPFLNSITAGFVSAGNFGDNNEMQNGWNLEELESLSQLRELHAYNLERSMLISEASPLVNKYHLKYLQLDCTLKRYEDEDITKIEILFEKLSPPTCLNELLIHEFFGRHYPTWMENSFPHLMELYLINCRSWPVLPPLGQLPSLKILKIIGSNSIVKIGSEFLNYRVRGRIIVKIPFPKLEILQIEEMPNLEEWCLKTEENKKGDIYFPSLKKLNVINCPKLGAMPQELKHAKNLKEVFIKGVHCIMEISLNPYCDGLHIENCRGLERIGDHPKTTRVNIFLCPALRCVQNFDALVELRVAYDLLNAYAPWLPELIDRQNLLHGDNFRVYYFRVEHSS